MDVDAPYPLRTDPVYRHYIWGGSGLHELLGKPLGPDGTLAESWEVADDARVANGPWQGQTMREVDEATGGLLRGDTPSYPNARISLLIKLSDAAQDLSVQIHPTDEQALRDEPERGYPGKSEMYVILQAEPGAGIYWGLQAGTSKEELERACRSGKGVRELLHFVPVVAGDVLYSPSGVVHAIGKGVVYCEVQQNSDITYRLYDWGRLDAQGKPRPLHLGRGLAVIDPHPPVRPTIQPLTLPMPSSTVVETRFAQSEVGLESYQVAAKARGTRRLACATPHFAVELLELEGPTELTRARRALAAAIVLEGRVLIEGPAAETVLCETGQSLVIPASLSGVVATPEGDGGARILLAYVPEMQADIVAPLLAAGYTAAEIAQLGEVPGYPAERA